MGSDKNKHDIFVWDRVVKDASCYLRNEQLNPPICVVYFQGEVLWYLHPLCVCRLNRSVYHS